MQTITKENCQKIGYFQKPHGVFGSLVLQFTEGLEELIEEIPIFLVETEGILVPWFVTEDGVRITSSKTALVDLEWIEDEPAAKKLCGKAVWIEKLDGEEEFQDPEASQWIGYSVSDINSGYLGEVTEVNDYAGNIVLTLANSETTLLVPYHPDLISNLDPEKKTMMLILPEGYSEI